MLGFTLPWVDLIFPASARISAVIFSRFLSETSSYRGRGLGAAVLQELEAAARADGCKTV